MSFLGDELVNPISFKEDFLIREIVLTHDPDDRGLDSELLLHLAESTFCSTTENVFDAQIDAIGTNNVDLTGSEEPISFIIYKISNEMLSQCFEDQNLHRKTLALLEMLTHYRWDAKVVLALASFTRSFGLFWLILQLQSDNALAVLLATFKRLPKAVSLLKPKLKALNLLINTMIKLTKLVISFEGMSLQHELVDDKTMDITKSKIYMATYWIFRSILVCSSQIADLRNLRLEKYSDRTVIAAWELHSLGNKLNNLCDELGEYVEKGQQQIETRLYEKLLHMFKENQEDNENALRTLFALQNEFPFKNPSSIEKCGVHELKNKVVIILISKPDLLPVDKVFLLVQQTSDHLQHTETEVNYAILWVPISPSHEWTHSDKTSFEFFSSRLPWFIVRRPWSLNSTVIKYIKQEWNFKEDPILVVLDKNGVVTNSNAMDMAWIWGPKAFPFSSSREKELWEDENWMVDLMISGINPLLSKWVEEGKNLCLYGSNNMDWIREFNATINTIKSAGIQLEVVYIGCKNPNENVKAIIDTIDQEKLSTSLTISKVHLFWCRLESIKRSIRYQDHTTTNKIANKLSELIDFNDDNKSWAMFGKGSSDNVIKLDEDKLKECVKHFPFWCKNVASMGLVGAIRSAFEGPHDGGKCDHVEVVPYGEEGLSDKQLICGLCKRPMQKFVLYKCDK